MTVVAIKDSTIKPQQAFMSFGMSHFWHKTDLFHHSFDPDFILGLTFLTDILTDSVHGTNSEPSLTFYRYCLFSRIIYFTLNIRCHFKYKKAFVFPGTFKFIVLMTSNLSKKVFFKTIPVQSSNVNLSPVYVFFSIVL